MNTDTWRAWGDAHVVRSGLLSDVVGANVGPIFERAAGTEIWDTDGKRYLDFNSGQMCSALGHNHPRVTKTVQAALEKLTHASSVYYNVDRKSVV